MGRRISWPRWARRLEGLAPSESLIVHELARLADWRGEAICSIGWLAASTGRHRSTVLRGLRRLEDRGVLVRRARRVDGRQAAGGFVLIPRPERDGPARPAPRPARRLAPVPDVSLDGPVLAAQDGEELRRLILEAIDAGWRGRAAEVIARSLVLAVDTKLAGVVRRGVRLSRMSRDEAVMDTISWAWEALRLNAERIAAADAPWAMWTTITQRATGERDGARRDGARVVLVEPDRMPRGLGLPGELTVDPDRVGLDDLGDVLGSVAAALVGAGMDEAVAWAGTRRVVELSLASPSRRHTLAGEDPRLADLGADAACAREWMTLLVGSRRGARASVVDLAAGELAGRARRVVEAYNRAEFT